MRSRRLSAVAGLAVAALALAGCGLGSSDDTSSGSKPTVDANTKVTGEVSLQTWALKPKFTTYVEGVIKALGMLRGWKEGYAIPSFGLLVDRRFAGQGLGGKGGHRRQTASTHEISWI